MVDGKHDAPRTRQIVGNDSVQRAYRETREAETFEEIVLERDDNLPLAFEGRLLGSNDFDEDVPRGTCVRVFATKSGRLVTSVWQWQRTERSSRSRRAAAVHDRPEEALAWLVRDGRGLLGHASREAWKRACLAWAPLCGLEVERID